MLSHCFRNPCVFKRFLMESIRSKSTYNGERVQNDGMSRVFIHFDRQNSLGCSIKLKLEHLYWPYLQSGQMASTFVVQPSGCILARRKLKLGLQTYFTKVRTFQPTALNICKRTYQTDKDSRLFWPQRHRVHRETRRKNNQKKIFNFFSPCFSVNSVSLWFEYSLVEACFAG
jgi:hypothetical protein